jgi:hypothetical protein
VDGARGGTSHTKPSSPVTRKLIRHPAQLVANATTGTAITAPIAVPAVKMAVAIERSRVGNHSATVLIADGSVPLSPSPRQKRSTTSPANPIAAACSDAANDHHVIARLIPMRTPMESTRRPKTTGPSV